MTTKVNIYCLFERDGNFYGVYSSLRAAHRDALKISNRGLREVLIEENGRYHKATFETLRGFFQGEMDKKIRYINGSTGAVILKTKLKE